MDNLQYLDPQSLKVHPRLAEVPILHADPADPKFKALVEDIRLEGILDPVKVTPDGYLADGRRRLAAAKRLQLTTIPAIPITEEQVPLIVVGSVLHRTHCTATQRAYLLVPLIPDAFAAAERRRLANLKRGVNPPLSSSEESSFRFEESDRPVRVADFGKLLSKSIDEWAEHVGVSVRLLQLARKVLKSFEEHPEPWSWNDANKLKALGHDPDDKLSFREYFEPQILADDDPLSLADVVRAIAFKLQQAEAEKAGKKHKGGTPEEPKRQLELFTKTFRDLTHRYDYWQSFSEDEKEEASMVVLDSIAAMPDDLFARLKSQVRKEDARRKNTSTAN